MGELLIWLLAATALGLLVGWQIRRHRAAARRAQAAAQQRLQQQAERERIVAAEAEREVQRLAALQAEQQRRAADRAAAERSAAALAEREHLAAEQAQREAQRIAAEQAQAQRMAAEQAEARRRAALRAEQQRIAAERAEAERTAAERQAAEAVREAQRLTDEMAAVAVPPRMPKSAAQTLVLVADDSKVVRIKTGRLLALHQYQVSYASDGLEAVQQMQAQLPDLVITDVEMPGMDGFELTRHIRGNPQTAQLPVIMITAADDRHREQADAAGVSVLLGKPYREDELIAHIRLALGQHAAAPQGAGRSAHDTLDALA